jgi:hypothetical protein
MLCILYASHGKVVYVHMILMYHVFERMSYQQSILVKSLISYPYGIVFPFCLLDCSILASIGVNFKKS